MNLLSKLHKNYILTGPLDCYCLVCDSSLRTQDDAHLHIDKALHLKNLSMTPHVAKYEEDKIIKVKKGYYCTFCNMLLTVTKVGLHIKEPSHIDNRGAHLLCRINSTIVAFDEVEITQDGWHGFVGNTCVLCTKDFDNPVEHKLDPTHLLNLIQTKCTFGVGYIYRRVDEDSFFCLICCSINSNDNKASHHESEDHKHHYKSGKELRNESLKNADKKKQNSDATVTVKESPNKSTNIKTVKDKIVANIAKSNDAAKILDKKVDKGIAKPAKPNTVAKSGVIGEKVDKKTTDVKLAKGEVVDEKVAISKTDTKPEKPNSTSKPKEIDVKRKVDELVDKSKVANHEKTYPEAVDNRKRHKLIDEFFDSLKTSDMSIADYEDFFDKTGKFGKIGKEPKLHQFLMVNDFIVREQNNSLWCFLCDASLSQPAKGHVESLHHQTILQNHKEYLYKKLNVPHADLKTVIPKSAAQGKHKKVSQTENVANESTTNADTKSNEETIATDQLKLKKDTQSKDKAKKPQQNPNDKTSSDKKEDDTNTSKMLDVKKYQKNGVTIDISSKTAHCVRCNEDLAFDGLDKHIKECPKDTSKIRDEIDETPVDLKVFAEEHHMTISNNKVDCDLCNASIVLDLKKMTSHVNSFAHKDKVVANTGSGPVTKVTASEFMNTFMRVESTLRTEIIVNNEFVMSYNSFHCVLDSGISVSCELCQLDFRQGTGDKLTQHIATPEHRALLADCNVVTSMPNEFIREIRAGVYHCGYCNAVLSPWQELLEHIVGLSHIGARRLAWWSLERARPVLRTARPLQVNSMQALVLA